MSLPIDPTLEALLPELRRRQLAFLRARLVSPAAEREWREQVEAGLRALLSAPVGRVVDADKLADCVDAALAQPSFQASLRPAIEAWLMLESARLAEEARPLGSYVPASARTPLRALLSHPELLPERLIRALLEHAAVEELMRDVLHEALREFSEKVNPFVAEWGLPALLKRLGPFGLAGASKSFDAMRAEFDRRLEPEIRKFLQGFSRHALKTLTDSAIAKRNAPAFVDLRHELAAWFLDQPIASLVVPHDEERSRLARTLAFDIAEHIASETKAMRRAAIALAVRAHAEQSIGAALEVYGVRLEPDLDALAAASWPVVVELAQSESVGAWLDKLLGEFFDELATP
jgi:hypothetical protein